MKAIADHQLELPFPVAGGPETATRAAGGVFHAPVRRGEAAGGRPAPAAVPIPARCPVTGARTCYRDGCTHYHSEHDGRCSHPDALAANRSRRRRR